MAIICGPSHHPSCPARGAAGRACICSSESSSGAHGKGVAPTTPVAAGESAHGAAAGAVPPQVEPLVAYVAERQRRADEIRDELLMLRGARTSAEVA